MEHAVWMDTLLEAVTQVGDGEWNAFARLDFTVLDLHGQVAGQVTLIVWAPQGKGIYHATFNEGTHLVGGSQASHLQPFADGIRAAGEDAG